NPKPGDPRVWLEREYYHSGRETGITKTDSQYATELKAWLNGEVIREFLIDPSAASFNAELQKQGFPTRDADNDVLDGIRTQARMLVSGEYKINKICTQTIKDYSAYLWDKRAQERGEDKPLKQNDHTKDFERYALFTNFGESSTARATVSKGRH
ncbi:MAG: PBSX family phage terminase large subunit, partial [Culicoidibacterales bacterium]